MLFRLLSAVAFSHALLTASPAYADDWLAVWPTCSIDDASRPTLSLLYPAPGLPAVVHAGQSLTARLRTPSALTPPPGVQQERVLERWTIELRGSALHVGVDLKERHRHVLPVVSIRPDGGDSLVYRVRIEIPAYVAPGTYAFSLRSPFGTRSAEQAVRVLPKSATPRVVRLPAGMLLPPPAAGTWPVDIWLAGAAAEEEARQGELLVGVPSAVPSADSNDAPAEPTAEHDLAHDASDPSPTLLTEGSSVALRIGSQLWVRNGCADDTAFEREVAAVLATEHLTRTPFDVRHAAPPPLAAALISPLAIEIQPDRVTVDNASSQILREVSFLLPFASGATADGGTLALHPASEPNARQPVTKLARWSIAAGVKATLQLAPAREPDETLALRPHTARSGQPARVRVLGADPTAKVAYTLGFSRSAYASPDLATSFSGPLAYPVRAQVFEPDGTGQVVHGPLWVEPHRPPNCAIARSGLGTNDTNDTNPTGGLFLALAGLALLVRRHRFAKKAPPGEPVE